MLISLKKSFVFVESHTERMARREEGKESEWGLRAKLSQQEVLGAEGEREKGGGRSETAFRPTPEPRQKPRVAAQNVFPTPEGAIERGSIFGAWDGRMHAQKKRQF